MIKRVVLLCAAMLLALNLPARAADVVIVNLDTPGVGFNDTTAVAPVGGNGGTTRGQQRLIAAEFVADLWGEVLQSSVTIVIGGSFDALPCGAGGGVLGSAGPETFVRNYPGAPMSSTWYPIALANATASTDLNGSSAEIGMMFNGDVDDNNGCLAGTNWYYGLDGQPGGDIDFVSVLAHEMSHGLGFAGLIGENGAAFSGSFSSFARNSLDNRLGLTFDLMSQSQRADALVSVDNLVWAGAAVNELAATALSAGLDGNGLVRLYAPGSYAPGSTWAHFDLSVSPDVLMEPSLGVVDAGSGFDLTAALMQDIGWTMLDLDADLVTDTFDNCIHTANADQRDTDNDNIGNACDPDIAPTPVNDCLVNFADLNAMKAAFFTTPSAPDWNADADFNNDNSVNFADLERMKASFFGVPGLSGQPNACN